ncbi:hypothetical protein [Actinoplanes sp. G11-F43]|uniref:hypothetical protein n=1 Tax=Actinoplanes sp. G11-F43 TaxID=3424130 RepID=UPI003D34437D
MDTRQWQPYSSAQAPAPWPEYEPWPSYQAAPLVEAPPPAERRRRGRVVILAVALVVVNVLFLIGAVAWKTDGFARFRPAAAPVAGGIPALPPPDPDGPGLPTGGPAPEPAGKVAGATFAAGDETTTQRFAGFPFSFRTPAGWECAKARVELAAAKAWICVDGPGPDGAGQRVAVMLRPCPQPCGARAVRTMDGQWFTGADQPERLDDSTTVSQRAENAKGRYELVMSHYFAEDGDTPRWQVAVDASAPPAARADVQKVLNDVYARTS